ncbi:hypothetical protein D3C83_14700 [compost metagenome]
MCATVCTDFNLHISGSSSRVSQPGVRKSSIQPRSAQRASRVWMRESIFFE